MYIANLDQHPMRRPSRLLPGAGRGEAAVVWNSFDHKHYHCRNNDHTRNRGVFGRRNDSPEKRNNNHCQQENDGKDKSTDNSTKKPESTSTPTTRTKSFNEQYSIDTVVITIKDEYVDFDKQYTAKDFPGVDVKKIKIRNYEKTHSQSGYITLNKAGKRK